MKSVLTLWANLETARDDSSMNLNYVNSFMFKKKIKTKLPVQFYHFCNFLKYNLNRTFIC